MFETWGRIVHRRRWLVLVIALAGVMIAAAWGTGVFRSLRSSGGFTPPASQSQRASDVITHTFGRDSADVVVLYRSGSRTVDDPSYRAAVTGAVAALPRANVDSAQTYWSTGSRQFVSAGRHQTYAVIQLKGANDDARKKSFDAIKGDLAAAGLSTKTGGQIPAQEAINKQVSSDIGKAEEFSMPVLLILLIVIFGSLAAASLPLALGGIAILGSFTALRLLTLATDVSVYSINITTILGLGLAIDYGLFMVSRFREELHRQPTVEDALARTVATAGRTVAVSGVTVAVATVRASASMGFGGVATVVVDMIAALTIMPALLAVLGHRVNALRLRRSVRRPRASERTDEQSGAWYRIAGSVMRRPVVYVASIVVVLLALGAPFLRITWGGTDGRVLPASAQARQVTETLNR